MNSESDIYVQVVDCFTPMTMTCMVDSWLFRSMLLKKSGFLFSKTLSKFRKYKRVKLPTLCLLLCHGQRLVVVFLLVCIVCCRLDVSKTQYFCD